MALAAVYFKVAFLLLLLLLLIYCLLLLHFFVSVSVSVLCYVVHCVISSFAVISLCKRGLVDYDSM